MRELFARIAARRRLVVVLQVVFVAALLGFLAWAVQDTWSDALPRLRDADPVDLAIACVVLAAYYLMFVLGWQWILRALGIRTSYGVALQSEMASMLAKYIPGAIWTPAARVLWLRKAGGIDKTSWSSLRSCSRPGSRRSPACSCSSARCRSSRAGTHRSGRSSSSASLSPGSSTRGSFGLSPGSCSDRSAPARRRPALADDARASGLLLGELDRRRSRLLFLIRAVGGDAGLEDAPYLGGTAAVGAIVAVLSVLAPSGLGVREASMYGLLLAVASAPVRARRDGPQPAGDHAGRGSAARGRIPGVEKHPRTRTLPGGQLARSSSSST